MCSLSGQDDEMDEILVLNTAEETLPTLCKKCGCQDIQVTLRGRNSYCQVCFLKLVTHKFRATMGKSKIIRRNDSVLIGCDGKANSIALLHLIKTAMNESTHKKLTINTTVLYIDDGIAKGQTPEERLCNIHTIANRIKGFGFTGYVASLNDALNEGTIDLSLIDSVELVDTKDLALNQAFCALPDITARNELRRQLCRRLIVHAARSLKCNKVFLADTSRDLASKVLSDVALGRGAQLSLNVGFCDARCSDVIILRPMRDFTESEVFHYLQHYNLSASGLEMTNAKNAPQSLQQITQDFVSYLESEFHSTVSTIFRTSEKLERRRSRKGIGRATEGDRASLIDDRKHCCDNKFGVARIRSTRFGLPAMDHHIGKSGKPRSVWKEFRDGMEYRRA
ncbi:hypothetical protein KM043_002056 [Ampulex compressa]|nr:hypothetical protein KM043_002056 [Ampulex compressa]